MLLGARLRFALRMAWRRLLGQIDRRLPLGIAGRLSIAFVVVAILAAAGNLLVTHGVSIVRTLYGDPTPRSPPLVALRAPPLFAIATPPAVPTIRRYVARLTVDSKAVEHFLVSVDRFERAVYARALIDSPLTTGQFQQADDGLTRVSAEDLSLAVQSVVLADLQMAAALKNYQSSGRELVALADSRRKTIHDYSTTFDAMSLRLTTSLDRAWKLFGRVIERQSLVELRKHLNELSRRFDGVRSADSYDAGAAGLLVLNETTFAETLAREEKSLTRSEGSPWVRSMHEDFSELIGLRRRLFALDLQRLAGARTFSTDGSKLTSTILALLLPHMTLVTLDDARDPPRAAAYFSLPPFLADDPLATAPLTTAMPPTTVATPIDTTRAIDLPRQGRALIAWITLFVLSLLLAISAWTVRSVAGPVRRMLAVIARMECGAMDARVSRGGVRELDTLGVAFNRMAEKLAIAQQATAGYQQQLEAKVTERTRQLQQLADHDPLTQLPNRRQLFTLLTAAVDRAAKARRYVGVFFLDIDNFKNLNDSMGHAFGDRVLIAVAQRLSEIASPFGFAARLGGDEFTVICENAPSANAVFDVGRGLVMAFHKPLVIDERNVAVSVSVGASEFPDHGRLAEVLLSAADAALFRAKALGRRQLAVFSPALLESAVNKYATEQGLRRAIDYNEFELYYQPEISVATLDVVVTEALIRWRQPDGRLSMPAEFLTVAEETGLIEEISDWVLRTAISTASYWYHGAWPEVCVAINVAARQLLNQRFVARVQELLEEFRLPPSCIELELTETVLQTGPMTIETLHRLRSLGIAVALDDFGTGYSSITSLEQLPLTRIKLDRSLIASIDKSARSAAIARAIIRLCNTLGLQVTAEGVERPEQMACLLGNRAILLQGYLFSRPVSTHELLNVKSSMSRQLNDVLSSISGLPPPGGDVIDIASASPKRSALGRNE